MGPTVCLCRMGKAPSALPCDAPVAGVATRRTIIGQHFAV